MKELPLSEATGIPRTTLRRYLKGQSSPRVDHLHALATCLGLDPADLLAEAAA